MTLAAIHLGASGYPNQVELDRRLLRRLFGGRVGKVTGFDPTPGAGMTMVMSAGEGVVRGRVSDGQGNYYASNDAAETKAWPAPALSPRIDALVLAVGDLQYGALGALVPAQGPQWVVVPGTPAASPVAPTDTEVSAQIGAGGWERWADVRVNPSDTTIAAANVTLRYGLASSGTTDWVDFKSSFTAAAGWTIQSARRIQVPGTSLWRWELDVTRTGTSLTANGNGNLTDSNIATLNDATARPPGNVFLPAYISGISTWTVRLSSTGVLTITDGSAGAVVSGALSIRGLVSTT